MAESRGKDGGFYVGSTLVTFMNVWSIEFSNDIEETTSFGDSSKKRVQVFRDWRARVSGFLDKSDAQQAALLDQLEDATFASQAVRFSTNGTSTYWAGSVVVESGGISAEAKGIFKIDLSLLGDGVITYVGS